MDNPKAAIILGTEREELGSRNGNIVPRQIGPESIVQVWVDVKNE